MGAAVVGRGFMGRTHGAAFTAIGCEVRGYVGAPPGMGIGLGLGLRGEGGGDFSPAAVGGEGVRVYSSLDEMLGDEGVGVVSVCTPTDTHVDIGVRVLGAGKHLLIEKPVALSVEEMQPLMRAAAEAEGRGLRVMPAHCMRFWAGWAEVRAIILGGEYGRVRGGRFRRVGGVPDWNRSFYLDHSRSGGPVFDLHVHDADYVLWCFGEPQGLRVSGNRMHFTTEYSYGDFAITAEAGWVEGSGVAFQMTFMLELEGCTLDFAFDRPDPLRIMHDGVTRAMPVGSGNAYENQAAHLVNAVREGRSDLRVTLADAERVTRLLEREAALLPE